MTVPLEPVNISSFERTIREEQGMLEYNNLKCLVSDR